MSEQQPHARDAALDQVREEYARRTDRFNAQSAGERRIFDLLMDRRHREYARMFARLGLLPLGERAVLDVGAGRNEWLVACRNEWGHSGAELCGIELLPERVEQGLAEHPSLKLVCGSADELPWPDDSFDLTHQGMLLSSILDAGLRERMAAEMARVTRPGGLVVWYDFVWNPGNRATVGISLAQVRRYFRSWRLVEHRRVTLAPPLARRLARIGEPAIDFCEAFRFLNFWQLAALRKPS